LKNSQEHGTNAFIVAEAGVNHNGEKPIAQKMVEAAAEAGADAVKFQTYVPELLVCSAAPKAAYQKRGTNQTESQLAMLERYRLEEADHRELLDCCTGNGIVFLSSPFDLQSIDLLDSLGLEVLKIPSGEITDLPYLRKIGSLGKELILSTGMADLDEIGKALDVLVSAGTPKNQITVLHCNTAYPSPFKDVNLRAMLTIRREFDVRVGFSDHTPGIEASVAAVAMGAVVIEKHFTLDKTMEGPDHAASLNTSELRSMVRAIRNIELSLGDGIKRQSKSETENKGIVRKSIVAARVIKQGDVFTTDNITVKRPGTGISPMLWDKIIGKRAKKHFRVDELIRL
jgi:N,N'-diacetyllegionaminate synthase